MIRKSNENAWRWHVVAGAAYAAIAIVCLNHGASLTRRIAAPGPDPDIFIWFLEWWPWSIAHGLDPFYTTLVWQPVGVSTLWVTSIPLLSALALPVTLLAGPVPSYNLIVVLAPAVSAWCAYRLCLRVSADPAAALLGGYLFGFSPNAMIQTFATPNLGVSCGVPLLLWLALARFDHAITRRRAVILLALIMMCEFLTSLEIAATMVLFAALTWVLAVLWSPSWRPGLTRLLVDALCAAPIVIVLLSPMLWLLVRHRNEFAIPWYWPYRYSADAAALIGGIGRRLPGQAPDFSVALLALILLFAWENLARPAARFLLALLVILVVVSLGPELWIDGRMTGIVLPWSLALHLPLLGAALPMRFALFVSLAAALIASLWAARPAGRWRPVRLALVGVACLLQPPGSHPAARLPDVPFFAPGRAEALLGPRPRLLILPFAINGDSTYWQVQNRFGFAQTGGYLGPPPAAAIDDPAVVQLFDGVQGPHFLTDFSNFCAATATQDVVAGPGTPPALRAALEQLRWPVQSVDGVVIFRVPAPGRTTHG